MLKKLLLQLGRIPSVSLGLKRQQFICLEIIQVEMPLAGFFLGAEGKDNTREGEWSLTLSLMGPFTGVVFTTPLSQSEHKSLFTFTRSRSVYVTVNLWLLFALSQRVKRLSRDYRQNCWHGVKPFNSNVGSFLIQYYCFHKMSTQFSLV